MTERPGRPRPPLPVTIRLLLQGADEPQCAMILERGWEMAFPDHALAFDVASFRELTEGELVLVAQGRTGEIVGFASIYLEEAFIHHLYVRPDAQGRGVGSALLLAALEMIGRRPATLKCAIGNHRALRFYARHGWTRGEEGSEMLGDWVRLLSPAKPPGG